MDPPTHVRRSGAGFVRVGVIALYLMTPVFAVLQWKFGLNLRLPEVLDTRTWAIAYYATLTGLGIAMAFVPAAGARVLAMLESAINILLNGASLMLWYAAQLDHAAKGEPVADGAAGDQFNFIGFLASLGIILVCYVWGQADRGRQKRQRGAAAAR